MPLSSPYTTTYAVSSTGNMKALLLNLFSVLNAATVPQKILLRLEGEFPGFAEFYLEQAAELARFQGVEFSINVFKSSGVRAARDWMISPEQCKTDLLWMGDDDVVFSPFFLRNILAQMSASLFVVSAAAETELIDISKTPTWGWICGSKGDLNNRRGYDNFNVKVSDPDRLPNGSSFNHFYDEKSVCLAVPEIRTLDTGCVILHVDAVHQSGAKFALFEDSTNCGGEDTLFALQLRKAGLKGYLFPGARAYHLEKEKIKFNEFAARGEMIMRACDLLGFDKKAVKEEFMTWLWSDKT